MALDFGFDPATIQVSRGETVRFIVENPTDLPHELFIGGDAAQAQHEVALLNAAPGALQAASEGDGGLFVPAHGVGQLEYRFDDPTVTVIGCHVPGHWASGMRAAITIGP